MLLHLSIFTTKMALTKIECFDYMIYLRASLQLKNAAAFANRILCMQKRTLLISFPFFLEKKNTSYSNEIFIIFSHTYT